MLWHLLWEMTWSCYFQTFIHVMMMHFNLRLTTYIQHIGRGGRNREMHRDAFCTSIAPAFGVQTFQRKLKSIVGMSHFVGKCYGIPTLDLQILPPLFKSVVIYAKIFTPLLFRMEWILRKKRSVLSFYVTTSDLEEEVSLECIVQLFRFSKLFYLVKEELTKDFQIFSAVAQSLCCIVKQVTDLTLT